MGRGAGGERFSHGAGGGRGRQMRGRWRTGKVQKKEEGQGHKAGDRGGGMYGGVGEAEAQKPCC